MFVVCLTGSFNPGGVGKHRCLSTFISGNKCAWRAFVYATCKPPPGPRCLLLVKNFIPREIYVCGGDLVMELQKWGCVLTSSRSHFLIFICVKKSRIFCGLYNLISWYFLNSVIYIDLFVFYFSSHSWALLATWSRPAVDVVPPRGSAHCSAN